MQHEGAIRRITWVNLILVGIGTVLFLLLRGIPFGLSFLVGGILTVGNLYFLGLIVSRLSQESYSKNKLIAQVLIKYLGMIGVLAFLMLVIHPKVVPFLFGLSTLVVAITVEGIRGIFN